MASGEDERHEKARELLKTDFVLLNIYPRNVEEEHLPRGPEGPFQFTERSVPVLIIKDSEGKTLYSQLGWFAGEAGVDRFAEAVEEARRKNGPVKPPEDEKEPAPPKVERWTSNDGKSISATLLAYDSAKEEAKFLLRNGKTSVVPLRRLSAESQARVREQFPPGG
ncbi:MAG: hypothetical protein HKN82_08800 [Akkermansiaceae bacterium]|nr:hypothetical protein [Akkermansiaceae bacterium]